MISNFTQANDEICDLVNKTWIAAIKNLDVPHEKLMRWYGVRVKNVPEIPSASHIWALTRVIKISEKQATLSTSVTAEGKRRFKIQGKVKIDINIPIATESSRRPGELLAHSMKVGLRGKQTENGVLFRNCELSDSGKNNGWDCCSVWADFEFYEIG